MNFLTSKIAEVCLKPIFLRYFLKEIRGLENVPRGNFILASNHQSHLDEIATGAVAVFSKHYHFHFIGQTDRYHPILKLLVYFIYFLTGTIPVNRKDEKSREALIGKAVEVLKNGDVLIMYPEGTRTRDGQIHEAKCGIAKIFLETKVPILPVAIKGTRDLMPVGKIIPRFEKKISILVGKPLFFEQELRALKENPVLYDKLIYDISQTVIKQIKVLYEEIQ